ncbi:CAP domain-containing protein [Caenimonas aquaedulcis]|uniref:CAP domain-containing protein n=1 Tax=Caenimonas aquaedulcis TaxID=2793270 RepID=A0A931H684_9BURK|nr:CAP domain-containing protein [Caenimonas aquaedulcis]MBG9389424.1 CAP domain-containing protein [Caenimonas aquaedulcis]
MVPSSRALRASLCAALVAFIAGCGGGDAPVAPLRADRPRTGPVPPAAPDSTQGLQPSHDPGGRQAQASTNGGYVIDAANRAQVLLFYRTVYASSTSAAIGWTGHLASCDAGDASADFRAAELRRINWFRAMAGVPASVQFDTGFNQKAQQAAMLMAANNSLSHTPPANWTCYNATAAEAAGKSNLALGRYGADSISDGYMRDSGDNNAAAGHRRWVLYPQTQLMGAGDVDGGVRANALWVIDANYFNPRPAVRDDFVAWPPKGYAPYPVVYPRWSFAYPNADFSAATVTMTENGVPIATRKEVPVNGVGENALVWFPGAYVDGMNWAKPSGDTVYQVTVSNVVVNGFARSFSYTTTVFDPDATASDPLAISGSSTLDAGQAGTYSFNAVTGATSYEWRTLATTPYTLVDGAEAGTGNFTLSTSAGYAVIASDVSASGAASFHFAQPQATDQTMTLNQALAATASSTLQFASRLGLSTPMQRALVEVSVDDGANWTAVFEQAGQQNGTTSSFGETSFSTKSISLAAYANRTIRLRWRYAVGQGSWYPQSSTGIGWYVDAIQLAGFSAVSANPPTEAVTTSFQATAGSGSFALQARAGMYGYYSDWGLLKPVSVTAAATGPDCLFNWAEANYPGLFSPPSASQTIGAYYFRHYAATGFYLGVSSQDSNVYYLNGGSVPTSAGTRTYWFGQTGCSP